MKACSLRCAVSADACRRPAAVDRSVPRKSLGGPKSSPWQAKRRLMSAPHFNHPGLGRAWRLTAEEILRAQSFRGPPWEA